MRQEFGDDCIGEFVKYQWGIRKGEVTCRDQPGTCKRNLCECDLDFAKKMPTQEILIKKLIFTVNRYKTELAISSQSF